MNRVCIVGRITRDLELRTSKNDTKFVFFTVAVSEYSPNSEERTNFIPCSAFGKTAENMTRFLSKGSLISVEGRITTKSNKTLDGRIETIVNVAADHVKFLEPKSKNNNQQLSSDYNVDQTNNLFQQDQTNHEQDSQNDEDLSILWE